LAADDRSVNRSVADDRSVDRSFAIAARIPDLEDHSSAVITMKPSSSDSPPVADDAIPLTSSLKNKTRKVSISDRGLPERRVSALKSSRVLPVVANDAVSEGASVQSKSTVSAFHRALEKGLLRADPVLTVLRRLLFAVCVVIVALAMATTSISKSVLNSGVQSAVTLTLIGDRLVTQQASAFWAQSLCTITVGCKTRLDFAEMSSELRTSLHEFKAFHDELLTHYLPTSPEEVSVCVVGLVVAVMMVSAGPQKAVFYDHKYTTNRLRNPSVIVNVTQYFADMTAEYLAAGASAVALSASAFNPLNQYVWQLIRNAPVLSEAFNTSAVYRYHAAVDALATSTALQTVMGAVASVF
jgi:hypothetical protein